MNSATDMVEKLLSDLQKLERLKALSGQKKILLVEDNQSDAILIGERFRDVGFDVEVVMDGEQALRKLFPLSTDYKLVLLDLKLPGIDGLAVLRRIRNVDEDFPVVIITGATDSDLLQKAAKLGYFGLLDKNKVQF